jgi:hypothetical protein
MNDPIRVALPGPSEVRTDLLDHVIAVGFVPGERLELSSSWLVVRVGIRSFFSRRSPDTSRSRNCWSLFLPLRGAGTGMNDSDGRPKPQPATTVSARAGSVPVEPSAGAPGGSGGQGVARFDLAQAVLLER